MIFNHSKVLKSCSLSTQSLASCVNYFVWNCLPCFSNTKIGSVTSFSILFNFQGPVSASADRLTTWLFYHRSDFLSSSFFQRLLNFLNLDVSKSLKSLWDFLTSIGSFQRLRAEALKVILLSQRLALKYNTTPPAFCQHFSASFFCLFAIHSGVRKSTRFECPPLRAGHLQRQLLLSLQPAQNGPFTRWAVMTGSRCGPVPDFPI